METDCNANKTSLTNFSKMTESDELSLMIISKLSESYTSLYYIHADSGEYRLISQNNEFENKVITRMVHGENFYEDSRKNAEIVMYPEDRDKAAPMFSKEAFEKAFGKNDFFSIDYRLLIEDIPVWYKIKAVKVYDENKVLHYAVGVMNNEEGRKRNRILGALPISPDILTKAKIGLWAFELDEGMPPRMYVDEAMLDLLGLEHQVPPEETYHAWYDHIDEASYGLVSDAVEKMQTGHAEVQYPWHHPNGETIIVRCGGVRNYEYTKGIRIEGTHQNVSNVIHFDAAELEKSRIQAVELVKNKLRADCLAFVSDNEPNLEKFFDFFGNRILMISGCDQVIFKSIDGSRIVLNADGIDDIPQDICAKCPFSTFTSKVYSDDGTVIMDDCREGYRGVHTHPYCPAKSSFMQHIYSDGKLVGLLAVHYLKEPHVFTKNGVDIMKTVSSYMGLLLGRIEAQKNDRARLLAESANKAKTEFLFNMSHDIRTPMNAILGFTNMAEKYIDDKERVLECLTKTNQSGQLLLSLINGILDMSRIEAGKTSLDERPGDVYLCFKNIEDTMQMLADSKGVYLSFEVCNIQDRYVFCDFDKCVRVFVNLITNAIKYTDEGGFVRVRCEQVGKTKNGVGSYCFTVEDSGIGMDEEFVEHIYEQFSREQTAVNNGIQGTGIGLSVCKSFVDLMNGSIECDSKKNVGTRFTVILPFTIQSGESYVDPATNSIISSKEIKPEDIDFTGKKILLVEDNDLNREIAMDILGDTGMIIEESVNGKEAVDIICQKGPDYYDFVLMDIQMPVMGGFEATKLIRKKFPDSKLPIIALSANAFSEDRLSSIEAGMNDHIAKPIVIDDLLSTLSKYV